MALTLFLSVFLIFSLVTLFVITSAFLGFIVTRVPFVPTPKENIRLIIDRLGISEKDMFYDLGSGDGRVVFLVEKLTGARTKGFELTWWTHWLAKVKKRILRSKAEFINKDFFKEDWHEATVIYAYLYPPLMGRVEEKFKNNCRGGSLAVIRDFPFPNLEPENVYPLPNGHKIFTYRLPKRL